MGGPFEQWPPNPGEPSAPCRRYYSTYTTLHDGNVLVIDGRCDSVDPNDIGYPNTPVIVHAQGDPGTWWWEPLYDARHDYGLPGSNNFDLDPYSFMWGLSDGSAFMGGGWFFADDAQILPAELFTRRLNPSLELWSAFPEQPTLAPGGSAVMYQKDKILKGGGFKPISSSDPRIEPSHKAYTIDAVSSVTSWTAVDDMPFDVNDPNEHEWITMLPLPDGQVFSVGGKAGSKPDLFNPYASSGQQWKQLAALQFNRQVHHSAVTLIDGSVFVGGGAGLSADPNTQNYQIYKPPYFFWESTYGPRPSFTPLSTPQIYYNTAFNLGTYDTVTKVRLIRTGATTHSFDQNTRMIDLEFNPIAEGVIRILPPLNGHVAPPGWYMLFIATGTNGTYPSVGQFVQLLPAPQ